MTQVTTGFGTRPLEMMSSSLVDGTHADGPHRSLVRKKAAPPAPEGSKGGLRAMRVQPRAAPPWLRPSCGAVGGPAIENAAGRWSNSAAQALGTAVARAFHFWKSSSSGLVEERLLCCCPPRSVRMSKAPPKPWCRCGKSHSRGHQQQASGAAWEMRVLTGYAWARHPEVRPTWEKAVSGMRCSGAY